LVDNKAISSWPLGKYALPTSIYGCPEEDWKIYYSIKYVEEEFEHTKGIIRIRKSKDRQHNGHKKKD
jgi:hypothetical protein